MTDINWDLIAKHLSKETDTTEEVQLATWINSSENNRRYFADLERWWLQVGQLAMYSKIDTKADWQIVKQQLQLYEPAQKIAYPQLNEPTQRKEWASRFVFGRYTYLKRVAAVIAILIISGAAYLSLHKRGMEAREVVFNRMEVPAGQRSQIVLADGTSVWLNSGSTLQFPAIFEGKSRLVKLEGEAYFKVTPDKKHPFIVRTLGLEVKVYGTSFNVTSYPNDDSDEVTLLSGSVGVSGLSSGQEIMLQPGQKISFRRDEFLFSNLLQADLESETAWRDDKLVFNDAPFGEIAKKLERRYDVTIRFDDKTVEQLRYRGAFRKESTLEQVIKAIQRTANFTYKIENDLIIIY